jgi:hypothetical protein
MKKFLLALSFSLFLCNVTVKSQDTGSESKFRFGLRVTPQPTWFSTGSDKNNIPSGARFGFGFGLNLEYKLNDVASVLTGIGGDFEGGKYDFKYNTDSLNGYEVRYWRNDNTGEFIKPGTKAENKITDLQNPEYTEYVLKSRTISTTFITIPIILKLSTKEYSGLKYFGMFGTEIGIRVKALAKDTYRESYNYNALGVRNNAGITSMSKIDIGGKDGDMNRFPLRMGLNVGAGVEYRISGSTSFFANINYFRSFWNYLRTDSPNMVYKAKSTSPGNVKYTFVSQNLILSAVKINVGIMF